MLITFRAVAEFFEKLACRHQWSNTWEREYWHPEGGIRVWRCSKCPIVKRVQMFPFPQRPSPHRVLPIGTNPSPQELGISRPPPPPAPPPRVVIPIKDSLDVMTSQLLAAAPPMPRVKPPRRYTREDQAQRVEQVVGRARAFLKYMGDETVAYVDGQRFALRETGHFQELQAALKALDETLP